MSSSVGAISENIVINDLLTRKCKVYKEVTGGGEVDLVADNGTRLFRIQVKTGSLRNGVIGVSVERRWRDESGNWARARYTTDTVDVMAVVNIEQRIIAYVPMSEFKDRITMTLRIGPQQSGQKKSVHYTDDFSAEKIISV